MASNQADKINKETPTNNFASFLESVPPGQLTTVNDLGLLKRQAEYLSGNTFLNKPDIRLYCNNELCSGVRVFRCIDDRGNTYLDSNREKFLYINYVCSNCQKTKKIFSLLIILEEDEDNDDIREPGPQVGKAYKFGEHPAFGPHVSNKLLSLVGSDRDLFLKGRRCENQGLGIAAFAYYRRVVENQKNRILSEVIRVAEKINTEPATIEQLRQAIQETQFTKALTIVKGAIPQSLLINGQNPLLLLHSALSEGLHEHSDVECLELATSIRIVFSELSERLAQALKDDTEVSKALQMLINKKADKQ